MVRPMGRRLPIICGLLALVLATSASSALAQQRPLLRISFPREDGSLTPYTFRNGYSLMTLVYDTLTWRDAGGVPRPWLARSVRRDGPRRVVVKLRRGVRWHDGRPLTAQDVVFTYRYVARRPHPRFTQQLSDVASVTAPDDDTVVFDLARPSLGFLDQPLADVPILPRHLWERVPQDRLAPPGLPVGSGPYRLVRHLPGRSYSFEANRRYFKGTPLVRRIDVPIIGTEAESSAEVDRGTLDAAPATVPPGTISPRMRRVRLAEGISYNGTMLTFNLRRPPFHRRAARLAVARALDLTRIAGKLRGPGATVTAERGILHPASRWAGRTDLHRADAAAARRTFAERGVGPFDVLASSDDGVRLQAARRVVEALRSAGAQARLVTRSASGYERSLGLGGATPNFDVAVVGIPALASYDPAYLRTLFGDPRTSALNESGYRSARYDRAAERVAAAPTVAARRRAVAAELRLIADDLPVVPLFFGGTTYAYASFDYDWVRVRGGSIVDKLSFLPGSRAAERPAAAAVANPADPAGDGGVSLVPVIIGLAALMALAGGWWLLRPARSGNAPGSRRSR